MTGGGWSDEPPMSAHHRLRPRQPTAAACLGARSGTLIGISIVTRFCSLISAPIGSLISTGFGRTPGSIKKGRLSIQGRAE
jgi:uncharacterized membrane protein